MFKENNKDRSRIFFFVQLTPDCDSLSKTTIRVSCEVTKTYKGSLLASHLTKCPIPSRLCHHDSLTTNILEKGISVSLPKPNVSDGSPGFC